MQSYLSWSTLALLLLLIPSPSHGIPWDDMVVDLPLFGPPPTTQFSGYLDATDGCDTQVNGAYCKLHYWLALAEGVENPLKEAPVILWLNGGPGSSSVLGWFQELGPLVINGTRNGFFHNPWSWTKVANLLILEAPVGVGYSYCENQKLWNQPCHNTDRFTASASLAALQDFFGNKFPELRSNHLFLTGESYAGVYLPTLAKEILAYNSKDPSSGPIPLRGMAVGDPCTDNDSQRESMDPLWYSHKYGLVDDTTFDILRNHCDGMWDSMGTPECRTALWKFFLSSSHALVNSRKWDRTFLDKYSLYAPVSPLDDEFMSEYMMRPDVRAALHVDEAPTTTWPRASQGFVYSKEYLSCNYWRSSTILNISMVDLYREIIPQLQVVYIYNGNADPTVSYEGTKVAVDKIGFPQVPGGGYRPWFYNKTSTTVDVLLGKSPLFGPDLTLQPMGAQFGGELVTYQHNLSFLTVHGAGHMVPQSRPQAALHIITKLLLHKNDEDYLLSPLTPVDEELIRITDTDDEFGRALTDWIDKARRPPFVDSRPNFKKMEQDERTNKLVTVE